MMLNCALLICVPRFGALKGRCIHYPGRGTPFTRKSFRSQEFADFVRGAPDFSRASSASRCFFLSQT